MTPQDTEALRQDLKAEAHAQHLRENRPKCPVHHTPMLFMYGAGWDYDRWVCGTPMCYHEIELEVSTMPKENK